ncbi:MAG: hypothetical protein QGG88_04625 [Gammaproteobacteria bacterium]|nr:hypothetical protein [Gammaproteobacteria bacterium]
MKLYRSLLVMVAVVVAGCASVGNEYALPSQDLSLLPDDGKTKVVFYNGNGLNPLYLDGSWRVGIKLDNVGVANLHIGEYVQVFLTPGDYDIELSHIDVFTFRDTYRVNVGADTVFVKVYNTPISTKYELQTDAPQNFGQEYEPGAY